MTDVYAPPLRTLAIPSICVGVLAVAVGFWLRGGHGAIGAVLGTTIVIGFFCVSQIVLTRVLNKNPELGMSAALALYLFKVIVLFLLLAIFKRVTVFDGKVFGMTVLACTLSWTFAEVRSHATARVLYVDPTAGAGSGKGPSASDSH